MPAPKAIEVILTRQLASYLAMPIFIVDAHGTLVFYNEPAEQILGLRFEETGEMPAAKWTKLFAPTSDHGRPLATRQLPLVIAVRERRPVHTVFRIRGLDGIKRRIGCTAFPLIGQTKRHLGAVAIFWEMAAT